MQYLHYKAADGSCRIAIYSPCALDAPAARCSTISYYACDATPADAPMLLLRYAVGSLYEQAVECCAPRPVRCSPPPAVREVVVDLSPCAAPPDLSLMKNLKKGDYYRVRVKGVNLNLYRVSLNGRDTTTTKPVDFPTFGLFGVEALSALAAGAGNLTALAAQAAPTAPVNVLPLEEIIAEHAAGQVDLAPAQQEVDGLVATAPAAFKSAMTKAMANETDGRKVRVFLHVWDQAKAAIKLTAEDYKRLQRMATAERMKEELDALEQQAHAVIGIKDATDRKTLDAHRFILRTKLAQPDAAFAPQLADRHFSLDGLADGYLAHRADLVEARSRARARAEAYGTYYTGNKEAIAGDDDLKDLHGRVTEGQKKLGSTLDEAIAALSVERVTEFLGTLVLLGNNHEQDYLSAPLQYNGGAGTIALRVDPLEGAKTNLSGYGTTLRFKDDAPSYTGASFGFFVSGLHDEAYSVLKTTTQVNDSTTKDEFTLVSESPGKAEFGASALFMFGRKCEGRDWLGYHFALGPGVAIGDKARARLLIGPGLSFGRKHMLMVTAGAVFGHVQRLSTVYAVDGKYTERPEDPTTTRLKGSGFFSLGYLFKF